MLQQQFEKNQNQTSPKWLQKLREQGFEKYQSQGLPTTRDEQWKYTNVKPIAKKEFIIAPVDEGFSPLNYAKQLDATQIFIVNGLYHSMFNAPKEGVIIKSLQNALREKLSGIKKLNQQADSIKHGFANLNNAFLNDGLYIHVEADVQVEKPIHIFFINTENESVQYIRNLFTSETGSKATIIEHYLSENSQQYQTNTISEIFVEKSASLQHIKIQTEAEDAYHIGTTKAEQEANSFFQSIVLSLGAKLSRSDTEITLKNSGAACEQHGLYLGQKRQHMDHHTLVEHQKPRCTSAQNYKGILDDAARAVFNGKVYVHPLAIKTDSSQMNKNLLLSDKAEIDTKPELEIYNDDVKCSHGATIGQLDETQLFYLLSRGLDKNTAKSILAYAFCFEVFNCIDDNVLKDYLGQLLLEKLAAGDTVRELLK